MGFVLVHVRLQGQAPDATGLRTPAAAGPPEAAIPAQRRLLLEGVASRHLYNAGAVGVSSTAGGGAREGVGALYAAHVVVVAVVLHVPGKRTVDDGAASLASVPFLGEFARGSCCSARVQVVRVGEGVVLGLLVAVRGWLLLLIQMILKLSVCRRRWVGVVGILLGLG